MNNMLNVALVGCGRVARHHARSIREVPHVRLVSVCDLVEERALSLAKEENAKSYTNYREMLNEHPEIDVVGIITPSGMHFEHAMDVIQNHRKHVVIEKPMVMRLSHGKILEETAAHCGVQVFPVFQYRFNKANQRVRQAVLSKEIGDLVLGTIRLRWCRPQRYYDRDPWRGIYAMDGGALTNQGIHHLDLIRYLAGEVKWVNAHMATLGAKIEVEDTLVAILEFENGALGVIEITTAARPDDFESSISVAGSKGLAMIGGWATNELQTFSLDPQATKTCSEVFPDVYGFGHKEIYRGIHRTLFGQGKPAVTYDDAMKSIQLLHTIYRSAELNRRVEFKDGEEFSRLGEPNEKVANLYRTPPLDRKAKAAMA